MKKNKNQSIEGFSIVELLIVLTIISIMSAITGYYLLNHQTAYKPDDQALKIIDILQEARQRSLTQRETLRVEIDLSDNIIRLIDENTPTTADDDRPIRQLALLPVEEVNIEVRPYEITDNPPEMLPVPSANFRPSIYPPSTPNRVCTLRFQSNGQVVDAGNSPIGANATTTGASLHVWAPNKTNPSESDIARAITVVGTTGSINLWAYDHNSTASNKWIDSRRR